ncbi:beta-N-acetylhexosaminidase [Ulvibacter antarcticus]|uniref:beta-N-acetylhexosaminidase n=1 Tax=Ulvibacter antarcticus TaxID=442714 RepID=A0A3L9Z283_9FLAO|nr:family 20 glycosylhydrolase [Ulvibacter antarcticus]RMA66107.1 hexosaminidase [Ulvibacter antarcticus]
MKKVILFLLVSVLIIGCKSETTTDLTNALIPKPQQIEVMDGTFTLDNKTTLFADQEFEVVANFLSGFLQMGAGIPMEKASEETAQIKILKDAAQAMEAYSLIVSENNIIIKASDASGAFYGVQTLRQLLPVFFETQNNIHNQTAVIPQLKIQDAPKFPYRGMHLDVSRHFFPKEFIKEYISYLALLKMNYFHWHLTDDQGWRIEILQYPDLTNNGAYRDETLIGHYNENPQLFDRKRYGGFYTQEDIKEIVEFATKHNVTIIPEIEMPGHAQAAISAYPELCCNGKDVKVATKWGVFENIFCPNQKTFAFLENVLTEVAELFPGEYIHIGGDEAPKVQWKTCAHCQKLIKEHNLKDEKGLQSYFIKKIETFLNSKGKKIIGWDEILEGGLAPNATVMSWRGTSGGIEAAKQKHPVIMTPTSHAYFDYYQSENSDEPLAIGGYLPLKKVFSFNPIPDELDAADSKFILGAQGNIWTEYIATKEQVEYMVFPRILAMSEVVWSGPSENLEEDYANFLLRVEPFLERLDALRVNYANHLYEIEGRVLKEDDKVLYELTTPTSGKEIRYSLNASEEKIYKTPIPISKDAVIKARVYKVGKVLGRPFTDTIHYHKGILGKVHLNVNPHASYSAGGKEALINGIQGSNSRYGDKEWLGFWGDDVEISIDFPEETEVNSVALRFYNANGQWIYAPKKASLCVELLDGNLVSSEVAIAPKNDTTIVEVLLEFEAVKTKKLLIKVPSFGMIPEGSQGSENNAWTFIDEVVIK